VYLFQGNSVAKILGLCYRFLFLKATEVLVCCVYLLLAQGQGGVS